MVFLIFLIIDLIEYVIVDLLKVKWNSFVKRTFYTHLLIFTLYFALSSCCFVMRGSSPEKGMATNCSLASNMTALVENMTENILQRMKREDMIVVNNKSSVGAEQDRASEDFLSTAMTDLQNFALLEVNSNSSVNETLGCGEDSEGYNPCFHNTYDSLDKQVRGDN